MKKVLMAVVVALAAAGGFWAGRGWAAGVLDASDARGAVVARFAGRTLHASEVEARLRSMPEIALARLAVPEGRRQLVEELVREQVLARLAEEKGYERDPEVARRCAEELGRFYLEKEFEEPERRKAPSDDELRRYFDEHRAELSRPERVRIALIAFKAASAAEREKKRALARATLAEAAPRPRTTAPSATSPGRAPRTSARGPRAGRSATRAARTSSAATARSWPGRPSS